MSKVMMEEEKSAAFYSNILASIAQGGKKKMLSMITRGGRMIGVGDNEDDMDINKEADLIVQSVLRAEQEVASVADDDSEETEDDRKPAAKKKKPSKKSADTPLTPVLYELAEVVAYCSVGSKPTRTGKAANIPAEKIRQRVFTVGSPELRQYWSRVSATKSFSRAGYRSSIRSNQRGAFRSTVDKLLAELVGSGKEARIMEEGKEMASSSGVAVRPRLDEDSSTEDLDDQDIATMQPFKSHSSEDEKQESLRPHIQELAEVVGRCLYKIYPRINIPRDVMNREVMEVGSPELQQIWTTALKTPRFAKKGYSSLVRAKDQALFSARRERVYSELMREKGANESVRQRNVANGRGRNLSTNIPKHVLFLQAPKKVHAAETRASTDPDERDSQKAVVLSESATSLPFVFQVLASFVSECLEESQKHEVCHQTLGEKVQSCDCQELKAMWSEKAKLYKFERTGYSMLLPRGLRKDFQQYLDQILSSGLDHTAAVVKTPPKPAYSASAKVTPENQGIRVGGRFTKARKLPQTGLSPVGSAKSDALGYPVTPPELARMSASPPRKSTRKANRAESAIAIETPEAIVSFTRQRVNRSQKRSAQEVTSADQSPSTGRKSKRLKSASAKNESAKAGAASTIANTGPLQSELETFFKWRFKRIDAAHVLFLDEMEDWMDQGGREAVARHGQRHIAGQRCDQLDILREFQASCCASVPDDDVALQCSLESFFQLVVVNWDKCFEEATKAVDNFGKRKRIPFAVFQQKQKNRWAFFLNAEKVCVENQLATLASFPVA